MMDTRGPSGAPHALSWTAVVLATVASGTGLLAPGVYARDSAWARAAWTGNDAATLLVAVPLLIVALKAVRRGSLAAQLLWYGMLAYLVYSYAYYALGAALNTLFPVYIALLVLPAMALAVLLHGTDPVVVASAFSPRTPVRPVALYLGLTGSGLCVGWLAQWAGIVFRGQAPAIGEEPFRLIASLDLALVVPMMLVAAVLLWRRAAWGYVWASIMAVKGATYTLVLTAGSLVGAVRGVEGAAAQVPVWAAWTAAGVAACAGLLAGPTGVRDTGSSATMAAQSHAARKRTP